jgi:hypothetical protein
MAANLNGIVINEVLPDPNSNTNNFDTDGNGTTETGDEFVELYNTSSNPVDISGWTLGDIIGTRFTFPSGTIVDPNTAVVVVSQYNGTPPEGFFSIGISAGVWNNTGDLIILSDDQGNQISAGYNDQSANGDDNFGNDTDGLSIQRSPDGSDTLIVTTPTPECFLTGTQILTENGYKPVEELNIGDQVQTADGKLEAVKWIGCQTVNPGEIFNPLRSHPIQIKAGALGENIPSRDLFVSPDHALLVDELLINAGALVNDISIIKTEPTETFIYHHVELENHALLLAEGAFAESYIPQKEDRMAYDNGAEYEKLYPHGSKLMLWPMDYPRVSGKNKVPRFVTQKLLKIASQIYFKSVKLAA